MRRFISMAALLLSVTAVAVSGQERRDATGVIAGRVINEAGEYVAGAEVHAISAESGLPSGYVRYVETDKDGNFKLDHLTWGSYYVFAKKEADGYPETSWDIYSNGVLTECGVTAANPKATVLVAIGPKAGTIVGTIVNAATGAPVENPGIRLWRWNNGTAFLDGRGDWKAPEYHQLVPANVEVGLQIHAPGFESWYCPNGATAVEAGPLVLKPGDKLKIDIKLRPLQQ